MVQCVAAHTDTSLEVLVVVNGCLGSYYNNGASALECSGLPWKCALPVWFRCLWHSHEGGLDVLLCAIYLPFSVRKADWLDCFLCVCVFCVRVSLVRRLVSMTDQVDAFVTPLVAVPSWIEAENFVAGESAALCT